MAEPARVEYQLPVKQASAFFEKAKKELPPDKHELFLQSFEPFAPPFENGPPQSIDEVRAATEPFLEGYPDLLKEYQELIVPPPKDTPKGEAMEEYIKKVSAMSKEEQETHFREFFEKQYKKDDTTVKTNEPPKDT